MKLKVAEVLANLKRLKGRSARELRERGSQGIAAFVERNRLSSRSTLPGDAIFLSRLNLAGLAHRPVSADRLLDHFRNRTSPAFFPSFRTAEPTKASLQERFGGISGASLIERANRITMGRFDLLGFKDLFFNDPIDWQLDPISGKRAPLIHWSRIHYLDPNLAGDKKVVWELNRHQYFATLGRAYWRTGNELYAKTFVEHLAAWMDSNPPNLGINWISSLEVAIRSISWLWGLYFFKGSAQLTPEFFLRTLKFLYLHGRHVETYLSLYFSPNTHLTGEALGLYYLGTVLPELECAERWRDTGARILLDSLDKQIRPDGVYFEQATYYHRYTCDFYLHFYLLSEANKDERGGSVISQLTALLDHLMYMTRPDGTTPLIGDDDGGRLAMLDDSRSDDFRSTLSTAAAVFNRSDYKQVASAFAEETLWLTGFNGQNAFHRIEAIPPARNSVAFQQGGYFIMRDDWSANANYLVVDCGPHGGLKYGHSHADALAFDLAALGRSMLVDTGTFTYTGSAKWRDIFRSSAAHNTLTIDGESSSISDGPFKWRHVAQSHLNHWHSHQGFDYFEGMHDGYMRLPDPATHTRGILFVKNEFWIMRDRINATTRHRYDLLFHFRPDAAPSVDPGGRIRHVSETDGRAGLELFAFGHNGAWAREDGWVSHCYGERTSAPVCRFSAEADGMAEFITFMIPMAAKKRGISISETNGSGGHSFEVQNADNLDVVMIGEGREIESLRIIADFKWCWVRFNRDGGPPTQFILLGGRRLSIDGKSIVDLADYAHYVFARRTGNEFLIETDSLERWRQPVSESTTHTLHCAS